MLDAVMLAQCLEGLRSSHVLELPNLRRQMSFQASSRLFDIGNSGVDRAEMLVLDLDDLTSRQYRRESIFA
jgi:hypothetical protein